MREIDQRTSSDLCWCLYLHTRYCGTFCCQGSKAKTYVVVGCTHVNLKYMPGLDVRCINDSGWYQALPSR